MIRVLTVLTLVLSVFSIKNGVGLTPAMGWNSWNHFGCNINEQVIRSTAEKIATSGLKDLGYNYVNIDDCWQSDRDPKTHKIIADPKTFPSGIKNLSDYVHSLGLNFGLYSDAGFKTCAGRPGSLHFEEIDAQSYADWGVDYLKYDNCNTDGTSGKTSRYPAMRDALNKTGRAIYFSICEWGSEKPWEWGKETGNSWRTTGDISDNWTSFIDILDKQVGLEKYVEVGAWNDPDMLEVGNGGMTVNEYQAQFAIWSVVKAPLILGCDINNITQEILDIISNPRIIAINQDPEGNPGYRASKDGDKEVWATKLQGNNWAAVLFNRGTTPATVRVTFSDLGFTAPGGNVRDLLKDTNLGYHQDFYETTVSGHSVEVIKLHVYCNELHNFLGCKDQVKN
jgi:alpha-galactosidase